jgi:hypothetical protein
MCISRTVTPPQHQSTASRGDKPSSVIVRGVCPSAPFSVPDESIESPSAVSIETARASTLRSRSRRSLRSIAPARRLSVAPLAFPTATHHIPLIEAGPVVSRRQLPRTRAVSLRSRPGSCTPSRFQNRMCHTPPASLVRPPAWLTARLIRFAFGGCDDEHS